jgi:hypothetical protein
MGEQAEQEIEMLGTTSTVGVELQKSHIGAGRSEGGNE